MRRIKLSELTRFLHPRGRLILGKRDESIAVLIVSLHLPLGPVQHILPALLQIPVSQFSLTHEPIRRVNINLREQQHEPISHIELLLVIEIILGVNEVLPLGLRLLGGRVFRVVGLELRVVRLYVHLLPLLVLPLALDVGHNWVERDAVMVEVAVGEGEVGTELEAAVAVGLVVALVGRVGDEQ